MKERDVPKLWHAKCGYLYMKQVLHIEDEEMLNAGTGTIQPHVLI